MLLQCNNVSEYFSDHKALASKAFAILPRLAGRESEGAALAITFLTHHAQDLDSLMERLYSGLGKESGEHGYLRLLLPSTTNWGYVETIVFNLKQPSKLLNE